MTTIQSKMSKMLNPLWQKMISSIQSCFPRNTGNGWNIPKMHILTRMIPNMLKFGAAEVFSGQHGERFIMFAVKDLPSNIRRQSASYVQELASRVWERGIIDTAYHRGVVPYLNEKYPKRFLKLMLFRVNSLCLLVQ